MPATLDSVLPAELVGSLDAEQLQAINEAPRGRRLAELAAALVQDEGEVLKRLSDLTGLPVANNLHADPDALRLFPSRLVHDYQMVPILSAEAVAAAQNPPEEDKGKKGSK